MKWNSNFNQRTIQKKTVKKQYLCFVLYYIAYTMLSYWSFMLCFKEQQSERRTWRNIRNYHSPDRPSARPLVLLAVTQPASIICHATLWSMASNTARALLKSWIGPLCLPSPLTALKSFSNTFTAYPLCFAARARTRPPMPPPATNTLSFLFSSSELERTIPFPPSTLTEHLFSFIFSLGYPYLYLIEPWCWTWLLLVHAHRICTEAIDHQWIGWRIQ